MSSSRNVAVVEYRATDGSVQTLAIPSKRGVGPAEELLGQKLQQMEIHPSRVTRIYTELHPSTLPGAKCEQLIKRIFPHAEVTWSFEYGAEASSRRRGIAALEKAIREIV